ncbi:hypothetical protein [Spirillospora sp. CA-294931]|uniref:hypothetical protein n=1 Tax=Spirillospora sp. CA-294931 TaxID=3240042 RepID=UPI003D942B21
MNGFLPGPRAVRCACGLLGCAASVGALSFGAVAPAEAAEPQPRERVPPICQQAEQWGDWYTERLCEQAWLAMYGRPRDAHRERPSSPPKIRVPKPSKSPEVRTQPKNTDRPAPRPRPVVPPPAGDSPSFPPHAPSSPLRPSPATVRDHAEGEASSSGSLQPLLLFGLLLPAVVALGYSQRHRLIASAGTAFFSPTAAFGAEDEQPSVPYNYRPAVDPFVLSVLGVTGPGAADSARVFALTALEECRDTALVVIPRPDATALFGLSEDDLLDETASGLFLPGNLDAALAYLETELAIRRDSGGTYARRLLLIADCEKDADRIKAISTRHPGEFTAILLGAWPGDQARIDHDGLLEAPPSLTGQLPERLPAVSRTEARDRLHKALENHRQPPLKRPRRGRR